MRKSFNDICQILITTVIVFGLVILSFEQAKADQMPDIPIDEVVVKLKSGTTINTILERYNATLLGSISETNLHFLKLPSGQTANQILPALNSDPSLYYAEPNYYMDGSPEGSLIIFTAHRAPSAELIIFTAHGDSTPIPSNGSNQWAWDEMGLYDAQKISHGQGIIVAVLDTGLAPDHSLLNSNITAGYNFVGMNTEIYDRGNGIDDDSNGIIDEFVGHGTHVSGILVTEAKGIQIMPIRVLNSEGVGTYWEVSAGIKYAVDHGADIISMSMSAPRLTPSLKDALDYAASHGVIVISAAGTGTGPNYPAAYSNPLSLGVGATDENDAIAWFSGGQVTDTDIYAPGTNIYSSFPYNGYALASGTSMSAPVVAGEAALLMSRYPEWTSEQVVQRIISKTDPVASSAVGRVNLSKALTTGVEAYYTVGDFNSPNDNNIKPAIHLVNHTAEDIPLNQIKVRYWYTSDSAQPQTFNCDYASIGCGATTGTFVNIPANSPNRTAASDIYLEAGFSTGAGYLPAGGQIDMYLRVNKADWSNYAEANDYSYDAARTVASRWDHITLYRNGALTWGIEPSNGQPPATQSVNTATAVPPSATSTAVPPIFTKTATVTKTATAVPASPTSLPPTATKTAIPTSLPPTATKTSTPVSSTATASGNSAVKVQYMIGATGASAQAIAPKLILFNNGSSSIPLNEIKIRYWYTADSAQTQSYWCDYAAIGCSNISAQFVTLSTAKPGADSYLEISFTSGAGSLAAGANTGQIQSRFSKNDWSYYTQTGDYSFDAAKTQFTDWNHITVYRSGVLIWGIEP